MPDSRFIGRWIFGATFVVLLLLLFNPFGLQAKEYVWDGTDTDWSDPNNWNVDATGGTDGSYPSESDHNVTFQDTSTQSCTILAGTVIANVTMAASYDPNVQDVNGVLTIGGAFTCVDLTISGGTFEHTAEINAIVSGNITVGNGALLMITSDTGLSKIDGGGTFTVDDGGGVLLHGIGAAGKGVLDVDDDTSIAGELKIHSDSTATANSQFRIMVASKTMTITSTARVEIRADGAATRIKLEDLCVLNVSGILWVTGGIGAGTARAEIMGNNAADDMTINVLSGGSVSIDYATISRLGTPRHHLHQRDPNHDGVPSRPVNHPYPNQPR